MKTHSEIMRSILKALDRNLEQSAAVYAILEERLWPRESNVENWSPLTYARSLAQNEVRKHSDLIDAVPVPQ
jgi:hypothetical protein